MSGAQTSSFADPNVLLRTLSGQQTAGVLGQQIENQQNQLMMPLRAQAAQQAIGQNEAEMIGRASMGVLSVPADQRPAAYQAAVANLQQYGFAKNAPSEYPGDDRMHQLSMMGIPSADQFKLQGLSNWAQSQAPVPGAGTGTGTATAPGSGYAPSGAPLTPYIAPNLPQGVSTAEDQAVRTVIGEAGGEPPIGQAAVAHVIKNRVDQSGGNVQSVVFAPNQFEPWNNPATRAKLEAIDPNSQQYQTILNNVVRPAFLSHDQGGSDDPTQGATHFYSPTAQAQLGRQPPSWATGTPTVIGRHNFYNLGYAAPPGSGTQPQTTAQGSQPPAGPVILGDSYASPDGIGGSGVVGAHQPQVLAQIRDQAKTGALQGKDVVISTGAVNDNGDTSRVAEQVQAAKDGRANSVTVVGVADGAPQSAATNARLQQIAQQSGAQFLPAGPVGKDGIHPANYAPLRQAVRLGGTAAAGPAAGPPPGSTAPAATVQPNVSPDVRTPAAPTDMIGPRPMPLMTANAPVTTPASIANTPVNAPTIPQPPPNQMAPGAPNGAPVPPAPPAAQQPPAAQPQQPPAAIRQPPQPPPMVQLIPPPPYNPQTGLTALQTQEDAHNRQAVAAGLMPIADYENHRQAQIQGNIQAQQSYQQQLQAQQNQRQAQELAVWNAANPPRGFPVHTVRNGVPGTIVMSTAGEQPNSFNPDPTRPATGSYEQQALAYKDDQNRMPAISSSAQTAQSGMMRLNELANIIPQLATGPASELRTRGAAWLESLGASPETIKTYTGMSSGSLAEELIKLSVATVGQAAKADLGSNVGIQSLQLYQSANPGISLLPDANKRMTNMARVSAQMTQDYAQGAQQHFNENQSQFLTDNAYAHPLSEYDQQWQQRNNPHIGAGAMGILNGDSFDKWALRVTPEEAKQAVAMAYRIDPTTMVPTAKGPVPAAQILGIKSGG